MLFHPGSGKAAGLARSLFERLYGPSTDLAPRIPVRFGSFTADELPEAPRLDSARSLIVVLIDGRMARDDDGGRGAGAWADLVVELLEQYPSGTSAECSVLPVAVDAGAFQLSGRLDGVSFVLLDDSKPQHLEQHVALGCLRLLADQPASADAHDVDRLPPTDVEVFISHAKLDKVGSRSGPVNGLLIAGRELPLKAWYDSSDIPPGARFAAEIDAAIRRCKVVIVVLTDAYSSREWCRRELLAAKARGRPIVVVDAITTRVVRMFPYVGNAPTVRWRAALATTEPSAAVRAEWEDEDAREVVVEALFEALRYRHEVARLTAVDSGGDAVVLGTHPESVTVAALPADAVRVLYPDPPLGRDELEYVQQARPSVELTTRLQRLALIKAPAEPSSIALSISGAHDIGRYGGSDLHLAAVAHDLALYLLFRGHKLVYGGSLEHGAPGDGTAPGDTVNYTKSLRELVLSYSPLARELGLPMSPIRNWIAWPVATQLTDDERDQSAGFTRLVVDDESMEPADLNVSPAEYERAAAGKFARVTALDRYLHARGLTRMRTRSTAEAAARVALGGKLLGYYGLMPGVVEEILLTVRAGKPVFLLGAFGGATRAVVDVLDGAAREEFTTAWCAANVAGWQDLRAEFDRRDPSAPSPEAMAAELAAFGTSGLAGAFHNGLTEDENRELVTTTDPWRAVELILRGLSAVE
ncbi:TIR domain-containing protein [Paractinoplanes durhamensis]|uniref:TIR domain-containing protein n=1 Tax=Paractinoplanes durhamensis TaxID=113563 RepID=A0ABQ3YTT3_9ACTN|nr:TIR domain-containing protein [Actinoplanes durhamensis]GIE01025.1 hypothetical protein Adu01nite_23750 [Actinoplanes durhamensis]